MKILKLLLLILSKRKLWKVHKKNLKFWVNFYWQNTDKYSIIILSTLKIEFKLYPQWIRKKRNISQRREPARGSGSGWGVSF
jgi:hypothetical protein